MCDNFVYGYDAEIHPEMTKPMRDMLMYDDDVELHPETTK